MIFAVLTVRQVLEKTFEKDPLPPQTLRYQLAVQLGVPPRTVQVLRPPFTARRSPLAHQCSAILMRAWRAETCWSICKALGMSETDSCYCAPPARPALPGLVPESPAEGQVSLTEARNRQQLRLQELCHFHGHRHRGCWECTLQHRECSCICRGCAHTEFHLFATADASTSPSPPGPPVGCNTVDTLTSTACRHLPTELTDAPGTCCSPQQ